MRWILVAAYLMGKETRIREVQLSVQGHIAKVTEIVFETVTLAETPVL